MDMKEAIAAAKGYVSDVYNDEHVTNLGLEEVERNAAGGWSITIGFSRPWNAPRTRTQEALENLGAFSSQRRSYKVITIDEAGTVISMKNRPPVAVAE